MRAGLRPAVCGIALAVLAASAFPAGAQSIADPLVMQALELEGSGHAREAAPLYRRALHGADPVAALLGLERVYAELGLTDSLVAPLDSLVVRLPADGTVRSIQLRTLHRLRRGDDVRAAASAWMRAAPGDPAPYRELARLLLVDGRTTAADSVISAARRALGSTAALAQEAAQVHAAAGAWEPSATAWREALVSQPWLADAAAHALAPAPADRREALRSVFLRAPVDAPARLALAALETRWGDAARAWAALRDLPADSAAADAWIAFGELAEAEGRWSEAQAAFTAALRWRAIPAVQVRAATVALHGGDAAAALALAPIPAHADSVGVAATYLPVRVRALGALGRAAEAERLVAAYDRMLPPGPRAALAQEVAMAWVRAGDMVRARRALATAGPDADSSAASGWIALYEGDAATARAVLARGEERSADVALALGVLARFREARAPSIGTAFLTVARGDTAAGAQAFVAAAAATPGAASLLLLHAARLHVAAGDSTAAARLWDRIVADHTASAEAPEALLHAARASVGRDRAGAVARLERLILAYPASALVPVARRELEALGGGRP